MTTRDPFLGAALEGVALQLNADFAAKILEPDDFARRFALRSRNLMWFLGAGASVSAGIPTAGDMIWDFKQNLFISQRKVSPQEVADLTNPHVRERLQSHIDSLGQLPSQGATNEYAALFEAVYPVEADRRAYLDGKVAGAKPSYGHIALATLMQARCAKLIWTTNFDTLVTDACARVYETTGALTVGTLDAPDLANQAVQDGRWPVEVKLHGDFRSRRLKNTSDELRQQDAKLRRLLVESCLRFGLIVVGYSGRDDSVMDALEEAVALPNSFPHGLFWLHRGDEAPFPKVTELLERAFDAKVDAGLVQISNFDETLRDLIRLTGNLDSKALDEFAGERSIKSGAPTPSGNRGWPIVRLNALPITEVPSICRRVSCEIGNTAEVKRAVRQANVDVIAVRSQLGVLAFGSDSDIRAAFQLYGISDFDIHPLDPYMHRYDSTQRGFLMDALTRAIERQLHLKGFRRGRRTFLVPSAPDAQIWSPLKDIVGSLNGTISENLNIRWREGIEIRLDWAADQLWLLFEPKTVFNIKTAESQSSTSSLGRERTFRRYNKDVNQLFDFWAEYLCQGDGRLQAMTMEDGLNAVFHISSITGFSRRAGV